MKWFLIFSVLFALTWIGMQVHPLFGYPLLFLFLVVLVWFSPLGKLDS